MSHSSDGDTTRHQSTASSPNLEPVALPDVQQLRLGSSRLSRRRLRSVESCIGFDTCAALEISAQDQLGCCSGSRTRGSACLGLPELKRRLSRIGNPAETRNPLFKLICLGVLMSGPAGSSEVRRKLQAAGLQPLREARGSAACCPRFFKPSVAPEALETRTTEYDPSANIGVAAARLRASRQSGGPMIVLASEVCVVDVGQAFFQLGQGLMAINAARISCVTGANVSAWIAGRDSPTGLG